MADFNKSSPSSGKLRTTLTAAANFASRLCLSSSCAMPSPLKDDMKESSHLEQEIEAINEKKKKSERAEGRGWHSLFTTAPCWHLSCICKRPAAFSLIWDFEMKLFYKFTLVVFFSFSDNRLYSPSEMHFSVVHLLTHHQVHIGR